MNRADRIKAFTMRCDGLTYEEISLALHYERSYIAEDLKSVVEGQIHYPKIIYPKLLAYVLMECNGSIEVFARKMGVAPHRLRRVLVHGDQPNERLVETIKNYTKLKGAFDK